MTNDLRPNGLHPRTWIRLNTAARCAGFPPPPLVETVSYRFRGQNSAPSDGNFTNEQQESEAFSSVFAVSLQQPTRWQGRALLDLCVCLAHQGIPVIAPLVDRHKPFSLLVGFDTNLPLHTNAVQYLMEFIRHEDAEYSVSYHKAWAREIPRDSWTRLAAKFRANLAEFSHVTFE